MRTTTLWPAMALLVACSDSNSTTTPDAAVTADAKPVTPDAPPTVTFHPGDDIQGPLIAARTGQTFLFTEGQYDFTQELSLTVAGVTLKGMGERNNIVLDWSGQTTGGNGILVTAGDFVIEGLSIQNTKGDSVRVQGPDADHKIKNVTFRNLKVSFTAGAVKENPGYAIYPTTAENVLIEDCDVSGVTDAGIYVGQSANIMVRNNTVHENVNGIEIENSTGAEVMNNTAMNNVAGILVFNLPHLPVKAGSMTVVHDNMILSNNHVAFSPANGGIAAQVPPGAGVFVLAADKTEVRDNTISGNESTGLVVIGCSTLAVILGDAATCTDTGYDGFAEGTNIHDNTFSNNGTSPQGFFQVFTTNPLPDILWDGSVDADKQDPNGDNKLCIKGNGSATYGKVSTTAPAPPDGSDLATHDCSHTAVPGVTVTWGAE
jgi:parallel beta-helix repeat protein